MSMRPVSLHGPNSIGNSTLAGSTPVGGQIIVRRSSDSAAKTNNTLANDDTLKLSVAANEVWFFEAFLIESAANATMDFKVGWSVPAGTTMLWGTIGNGTQITGGYMGIAAGGTPTPMITESGTVSYGSQNGITGHPALGIIAVGGTAGVVNLQWAQDTTDAGNLVLKANAYIRATRLA